MPNRSPSKQRLEELIALARTYRGWSSKDLARELGRDTHHLVPNSGVPKLDIVVALAEALDWTVQDVVDDLYGNVPSGVKEKPAESWAELDRAAWEALQKGEYHDAALLARRAFAAAASGEQRGYACMRECGAWDGLGRYHLAMEACQRGLRERGRGLQLSLTLRDNLANFHYLLGNFDEAYGIATATITLIEERDLEDDLARASLGFARFVRGNAVRCMMMSGGEWSDDDAAGALRDLRAASELLSASAEILRSPIHREAASIADGAAIAVAAVSGRTSVESAIQAYLSYLDDYVDLAAVDKIQLETVGWWSVFAAELAFARVRESGELARLLGIFTNKVSEVAEITGNWAFRERVWFLELTRRDTGGVNEPWIIDADDARELSGAMARFPRFRAIGWRVFRSAEIGEGG